MVTVHEKKRTGGDHDNSTQHWRWCLARGQCGWRARGWKLYGFFAKLTGHMNSPWILRVFRYPTCPFPSFSDFNCGSWFNYIQLTVLQWCADGPVVACCDTRCITTTTIAPLGSLTWSGEWAGRACVCSRRTRAVWISRFPSSCCNEWWSEAEWNKVNKTSSC